MVCNGIFSLYLGRILVVELSSSNKEIYLRVSSDVKFYIATFEKKKTICKTSFLNQESPCHIQEIFKLLNKR